MSDKRLEVTTDEQRTRFHKLRSQGGQCSACGRPLGPDETVYMERFDMGPVAGRWSSAVAAVGVECASDRFVEVMEGQEPERCAGCGRPVFYRRPSTRRQQALCSRACGAVVQTAKRQKVEG